MSREVIFVLSRGFVDVAIQVFVGEIEAKVNVLGMELMGFYLRGGQQTEVGEQENMVRILIFSRDS